MRCAVVIAVLSGLPLTVAVADVYRSVDAQGHVQYSDTPTAGAELIRSSGTRYTSSLSPNASPSADQGGAKAPSAVKKSDDQLRDELNKEAAAHQVQNDVAQSRADQCKKAQDDYQRMISARRLYTTDANGERQYVSDAEADQSRLKAKQAIDDLCQ